MSRDDEFKLPKLNSCACTYGENFIEGMGKVSFWKASRNVLPWRWVYSYECYYMEEKAGPRMSSFPNSVIGRGIRAIHNKGWEGRNTAIIPVISHLRKWISGVLTMSALLNSACFFTGVNYAAELRFTFGRDLNCRAFGSPGTAKITVASGTDEYNFFLLYIIIMTLYC